MHIVNWLYVICWYLAGETVSSKARVSHLHSVGSGGLADKTKQISCPCHLTFRVNMYRSSARVCSGQKLTSDLYNVSGHFLTLWALRQSHIKILRYRKRLCPEICCKVMHCFSLLIFILVFYMQISKPLYFFCLFVVQVTCIKSEDLMWHMTVVCESCYWKICT